jgi:hypothetical protein
MTIDVDPAVRGADSINTECGRVSLRVYVTGPVGCRMGVDHEDSLS